MPRSPKVSPGARDAGYDGGVRYLGQTVAFEWLASEHTLISVSGAREFAKSDWQHYVDTLRTHQDEDARILVLAGAAKPSRAQQRQLTSLPNHDRRRVVLVSESVALRFVVTVLALAAPWVKLFPPHQMGEALAFLELDPRQANNVHKALSQLATEFRHQASVT